MLSCVFRPEDHLVVETEVVRFLRRHLRDDKFFLYRHRQRGTWVVAYWLKPGERMLELQMHLSPGCLTRDHVASLERWHKGKTQTPREAAKMMAEEERKGTRDWVDEMDEQRKVKRWLGDQQNHVQRTHPDWDLPGFRTRPLVNRRGVA